MLVFICDGIIDYIFLSFNYFFILKANVNEEDKHIELKLLNDSVSPDLKP